VPGYEQRDGAFATLFADVTDAWFEGRGPDIGLLTAVPRPEIHSYCKGLSLPVPPSTTLADLHGSEDRTERDALIPAGASRVSAPGVHKVDEQLYVLDLGISTGSFRVTSKSPAVEVMPESLEGGALFTPTRSHLSRDAGGQNLTRPRGLELATCWFHSFV